MSIVSKRSTFFTLLFAHLLESNLDNLNVESKMAIIRDFKSNYNFTGEPITDDELYSVLLGLDELKLIPDTLTINNPDTLYTRIAELSAIIKEKMDTVQECVQQLDRALYGIVTVDEGKQIVQEQVGKLRFMKDEAIDKMNRILS